MPLDTTPIIEIKKPIWGGRYVGISPEAAKSPSQLYKIQVAYERVSDGERSYPRDYYMRGRDITAYPLKVFKSKGGVEFGVHVIPIADLPADKPGQDISKCHYAILTKHGECPECIRKREG